MEKTRKWIVLLRTAEKLNDLDEPFGISSKFRRWEFKYLDRAESSCLVYSDTADATKTFTMITELNRMGDKIESIIPIYGEISSDAKDI